MRLAGRAWPAVCCVAVCGILTGKAQLAVQPAGRPVPAVAPTQSLPASPATEATVFRIRVIDGRNGTALQGAHLRLWYDEASDAGFSLTTAENGTASMPEPLGLPLRILIAAEDRVDCRTPSPGEPAPGYNLQQIATRGIALTNRCGSISVKARPGELVFFARPLRWYENINRP